MALIEFLTGRKESFMDYVLVFITAPSEEIGADIARTLVSEGLAACVNIVRDIRSIYKWQGKIEDEPEVLMLAKTQGNMFGALEKRVKSMHPYSVPEIISVKITRGSGAYLEWLSETLSASGGGE